VRDRQRGITQRVSVDSSGAQGDTGSSARSISADGRFVAFTSSASNLVPNDTNHKVDAFVHDRQRGTTQRVSVKSSGAQASCSSECLLSISSDGRFVAFDSLASNLVPNDTNFTDVFVRDRQRGTTQRVSVDSSGNQANDSCYYSAISADGRFIAFGSWSSNLVPNDTNDMFDIFVQDVEPDTTAAPKVVTVVPARGATGVFSGTKVKATFSEPVYKVKDNFKLYRKGSSTPVDAVVTPVGGTNNKKWVLNPNRSLKAGTIYIAKVLTSIQDKVGHNLDQNSTTAGDQPLEWSFKTRS
jgi:hypothetical protein